MDGDQGATQPGSAGLVLANKLGITNPEEMAEAELVLLEKIYDDVLVENLPVRALTVGDLKTWHRHWLGNVYTWAGEERSVNLSKGGFMFAAAAQIPRLLVEFERDCLSRYTPCTILGDEELTEAIAVTHAEFILIHPFVEGNGRLSRLLADVMAVQAGREPLDYSAWDADREVYFAAIRTALGTDYTAMQRLVAQALSGGTVPG
ncbi:MAG: Fic family protein [Pseudomonadota bacterium]|nr:Fic family protein [Pseudomonadota bacterium]